MNKIVHYIGLDVHKETIAVSIAPQNSTEVRRYGIIGGTLDAADKLVKKLTPQRGHSKGSLKGVRLSLKGVRL